MHDINQRLTLSKDQLVREVDGHKQSFRLFHGRGKCYGEEFETLCIDYFHPFIFVTVFRDFEPDLEGDVSAYLAELEAVDGIEGLVFQIRRPLDIAADVEKRNSTSEQQPFFSFARFVLHHDRNFLVFSNCELERWFARFGDLRFKLSYDRQSIGYFLDSDPLKYWLKEDWQPAKSSAKILNTFSFTGGLGLAALKNDAVDEQGFLLNVDMSKGILKTAQTNFQLNKVQATQYRNVAADVRKLCSQRDKMRIDQNFELLIVDPPSFQKGSFNEQEDYLHCIKNLNPLLEDHAVIAACLNNPQVSIDAFSERLKDLIALGFNEREVLPSSVDFPDISGHSAFKCIILERD